MPKGLEHAQELRKMPGGGQWADVYPSLQITQSKIKLFCRCWRLPELGCVHARMLVCVCVYTHTPVYWRAEWRRWESGREVGDISFLGLRHSQEAWFAHTVTEQLENQTRGKRANQWLNLSAQTEHGEPRAGFWGELFTKNTRSHNSWNYVQWEHLVAGLVWVTILSNLLGDHYQSCLGEGWGLSAPETDGEGPIIHLQEKTSNKQGSDWKKKTVWLVACGLWHLLWRE